MAEENNWVNWALAAGGALLGAIALLATGAKPAGGQPAQAMNTNTLPSPSPNPAPTRGCGCGK